MKKVRISSLSNVEKTTGIPALDGNQLGISRLKIKSKNFNLSGEMEISNLPVLIYIQNLSVFNRAGLFVADETGVKYIAGGVTGISINDETSQWAIMKVESGVLKIINNRPGGASVNIRYVALNLP